MKKIEIVFTALFSILIITGCSRHKKDVTIVIKNPTITMNCVTDAEIKESQQFLKKAWNSFAAQYKKYNVHAEFIIFEQVDFEQNISDCYGTPYAADILYGAYFNMGTFIYQGHAVPLDSIITEEIRNDFEEEMWTSSKASNGKTYMLPFVNSQNVLSYNKKLFRECGLDKYISSREEIQNWSLDEWEEILSILKKKLPDTSFPMMMYAKNNQGDTHIMVMLRAKGSDFFDANGYFNLNTQEGIAGLQWIKDNYDKGYYPFGCERMEILDNADLFINNQLAIHIWNLALGSIYPEDFELGYVNFPSSSKQGAASSFISGFMAFDNNDKARLEVAKDFLQYIYSTSQWLDYSAGGIPCSKSVAVRHGDKIEKGKMFVENNKNIVDYQANNPNWLGVRAAFFPQINKLLKGSQTAAETAAALDRDCNAAIQEGYRKSRLHE